MRDYGECSEMLGLPGKGEETVQVVKGYGGSKLESVVSLVRKGPLGDPNLPPKRKLHVYRLSNFVAEITQKHDLSASKLLQHAKMFQ